MKHAQQRLEVFERKLIGSAVDRLLISRLNHFEVPAREFVPEEAINCHQGFADAELAEEVVYFGEHAVELRFKPLGGYLCIFGLLYVGHFPALNEAEGVPNLIVEVTALFAERVVVKDVVSGRSGKHQAHAHAVGAVAFHEFYRVG